MMRFPEDHEPGERRVHPEDERGGDNQYDGQVPGEQELAEPSDVLEDPPALLHGPFDRAEVVGGQHDVRGLAGDVGACAAHGDADVGLAQGRGVVDPIAGDGDDPASELQRTDEAQLVFGRDAGVHVHVADHVAGDHDDPDPGRVAGLDGIDGRRSR